MENPAFQAMEAAGVGYRVIRYGAVGAGTHGVAAALDADEALRALGATVADLTDPEAAPAG
jgi:hypothetical protein